MRAVDCLVVGGGPAGLSAAAAAARAGAEVVVVDENAQAGGQYYRQMPATFGPSRAAGVGAEQVEGQALIEQVRAVGVEVRTDTVAFGVFDTSTVGLARGGASERLTARTLVLAPGAYDRPVPFPGWTLPGVVTAGGAQNLMKAYGVLPGRRVLIAGTGPLLLVVAHYLVRGGATVVALCESSPAAALWREATGMLGHLGLARQGLGYWWEIRRARVPILMGHVVRRAEGAGAVERAVVARCDAQGDPVRGTDRTFDVDAVVVGYGFVPSVELARLAGCAIRYVPGVGGWVPERTGDMETTVEGVYAAGDGAGVAGSLVAGAEGTLAGLAAARRLGRLAPAAFAAEASPVRRRLAHLASFRAVMDRLYPTRPGFYRLAEPDTVLCRCEEVTLAEARVTIDGGARQMAEVKALTRIGMGRCQGRLCGPSLAHCIAERTGCGVGDTRPFSPRPPVKPVPLGALIHEV